MPIPTLPLLYSSIPRWIPSKSRSKSDGSAGIWDGSGNPNPPNGSNPSFIPIVPVQWSEKEPSIRGSAFWFGMGAGAGSVFWFGMGAGAGSVSWFGMGAGAVSGFWFEMGAGAGVAFEFGRDAA
jgi:hypothetical protein